MCETIAQQHANSVFDESLILMNVPCLMFVIRIMRNLVVSDKATSFESVVDAYS